MKHLPVPLLVLLALPLLLRGDESQSALSRVQLAPELLAEARVIEESFNTREIQKQIGLSPEEFEDYYHVLRQARDTNPALLKAAAAELQTERRKKLAEKYPQFARQTDEPFPQYVDLHQNPEPYLGQPVTLHGWIRKLVKYDAEENEAGITTQYEAWLYTPDSQQNPAVVICTSVPADMPAPTETNLTDGVTVTGYMFRRYLYDAQDSKRLVPLILAAKLEWQPPPEPEGIPLWAWLSLGAVGALLVGMAVWAGRVSQRSRQFTPDGQRAQEAPPDFSRLTDDTPAPPPG